MPQFALLDLRGPNPCAFLAACVWLVAAVGVSAALTQSRATSRRQWTATLTQITLPPIPSDPAEEAPPVSGPETAPSAPQSASLDLPPSVGGPTEAQTAGAPSPPTPWVAPDKTSWNSPSPMPITKMIAAIMPATSVANSEIASLPTNGTLAARLKLLPALPPPAAAPAPINRPAEAKANTGSPAVLGSLPLNNLLREQTALAAQLASLSGSQRAALPQVWIRVNAEWFEALPQTNERLYFSLTRPSGDSEVLAYVSATRSFALEHPQRPLWQIQDGDSVAALANLRAAAARQLGSSASLVGVYTWHPPVLESALEMFVLQRMRQLGARLGPQDVVTIRLASGPSGWVMNLEPIRVR